MFVEASVPARVNLFGNPLDIYGGLVISSALARRATVSAKGADGLRFVVGGRDFAVKGAGDLAAKGDAFDFLRALVRSLGDVGDCEIAASTDIPVRAGLAGSAALMLAASAALLALAGKDASAGAVIRAARRAEVDFLGNFCGWNDFYACALGGVHAFAYRGPVDGAPAAAPLRLPTEVSFAVALTGDRHRSGAVNLKLWERWRAGEAAVRDAYGALAALGLRARAAFDAGDWDAFGKLMVENFACQHRLGAANDVERGVVERATGLGALGAKLCGAGHCGGLVVLARAGDHARIGEGLREAGVRDYFAVETAEGMSVRRG